MEGHEQIECIKVENTSIQYDRVSHLYECPTCKKQHRYAEPQEGEFVFCIGTDFGLFVPKDPSEEQFTEYEEIINEDIPE